MIKFCSTTNEVSRPTGSTASYLRLHLYSPCGAFPFVTCHECFSQNVLSLHSERDLALNFSSTLKLREWTAA